MVLLGRDCQIPTCWSGIWQSLPSGLGSYFRRFLYDAFVTEGGLTSPAVLKHAIILTEMRVLGNLLGSEPSYPVMITIEATKVNRLWLALVAVEPGSTCIVAGCQNGI